MDGLTSRCSRDFRRYLVLLVLLQHALSTTPPVGAQQVTPTAGSGSNVTATPALLGNVTASSALLGNENTTSNNINVTQSQQTGNSTIATTTSLLGNTTNSISLPSNITNSTTTTPLLSNSTNATMTFTLPGNNTNITTINPTTLGNNNTNLTTVNALPGNSTNLTTVNPLLGNATTLFPVGNVTNGTTGNDDLAPSFDWSVIGIIIACSVFGFLQLLLLGLCCFLYVRKRKSASEKIGSKESLRPRDENDLEGRRKSIMKSNKDGTTDKKTKSEHRVTIVENKEELLAKTVPTPASQRRVLKADNSGIGGLYFPQRYKMPTSNKPPPTRMYSVQAHIGGKPVTFVRPVDRPASEPPPPGWMERFSQYLKEVGATATSSENK
ncbi:uncharacterized protein LOC118424489 [Branchiostoma floridae]|uniref:Uncharacterized protein LOC118424489 n=1 Tax=Branchiostoma floridae TaxID=7739 RepID=A0A9J7N260_BRAFL|nr:uncharacterized protein LOC118424489 [Branchiostoma floridae]